MADHDFAGPIDVVVFSFPPGASMAAGLDALLARVDAGAVEILDLEIIGSEGEHVGIDSLSDADRAALAAFDGAETDILDADDLALISESLDDGHFAVAVVYEDRSLASVAAAWAAVGAKEIFSGGVDVDELDHALKSSIEQGESA